MAIKSLFLSKILLSTLKTYKIEPKNLIYRQVLVVFVAKF